MVSPLRSILAIAGTSLQETARRKVLYVVIILIVFLGIVIGSGMAVLRMAIQSGETETVSSITGGFVQVTLGMWSFASMALGVFLGSVAISSEVSARTIVNVLARPVDRAAYLAGRWLGILAFLWGFVLVGILLALGVAVVFDVRFTPMLWLAFTQMFVGVTYISGVSLGLSVVMPALPAGATAVLLSTLPAMMTRILDHPMWFFRLPATAMYYLGPANLQTNLIADSFGKQALDPNYLQPIQVLTENLMYTTAVFVVACIIFSRRELRLR